MAGLMPLPLASAPHVAQVLSVLTCATTLTAGPEPDRKAREHPARAGKPGMTDLIQSQTEEHPRSRAEASC